LLKLGGYINKKPKYETNIAMLSGDIAKDIRQSYTGGSTDMFIPKNPIGTKIYVYDVNSLYPSVMLNHKYPVGNPTYFLRS
jgi:DNA polymerase elongation subunit (family B)